MNARTPFRISPPYLARHIQRFRHAGNIQSQLNSGADVKRGGRMNCHAGFADVDRTGWYFSVVNPNHAAHLDGIAIYSYGGVGSGRTAVGSPWPVPTESGECGMNASTGIGVAYTKSSSRWMDRVTQVNRELWLVLSGKCVENFRRQPRPATDCTEKANQAGAWTTSPRGYP
jgi:hypothetical protein